VPTSPGERCDGPLAAAPAAAGLATPYLLVLSGPQFGDLFDLPAGQEVVLGSGPVAQVRIHGDDVAPRHATIVVHGREARLIDAGSAGGTWLEGRRVPSGVLADGASFQVGAHTIVKFVASNSTAAELERRLARGALHEPLTGLYNRRHFEERLAAELAASQRHGRPLSLLLVDVDHLRRLNDELGPAAGDEVLKLVAQVVQGAVRKEDVAARVGGEELAVLARETGLTGARALGERIRKAVERSRCEWEGRELAITASVGVTVSTGLAEFEPGRTAQQLLDAAGRAPRRAKQGGRNTVIATPALGE
jgi:two-component system, cell cycle response regulator